MAVTIEAPSPSDVDLSTLTKESASELNRKWRAIAANEAYAPYVTRTENADGSTAIEINEAGRAFAAKMRTQKCARVRCQNNLGQEYAAHLGRGFSKNVKELDDVTILRRFVPFTYPQVDGAFYVDPFKATRIETVTNGEVYNELGFCGHKCMEVQLRADDARGGPLSAQQKQALHNAGFKLRRQYSKAVPRWSRSENNASMAIMGRTRSIYVYGFARGKSPNEVLREERQGEFSLDRQFDEALAFALSLKSRAYFEGEVHAETKPRTAEALALGHLSASLDEQIAQFEAALTAHRGAFNSASDPIAKAIAHAAMTGARGALNAVRNLRGDVDERISNKKGPSQSPTPYAVPEDQCANEWEQRSLRDAVEHLSK